MQSGKGGHAAGKKTIPNQSTDVLQSSGRSYISKIQLVVYRQFCVLIGWATARLDSESIRSWGIIINSQWKIVRGRGGGGLLTLFPWKGRGRLNRGFMVPQGFSVKFRIRLELINTKQEKKRNYVFTSVSKIYRASADDNNTGNQAGSSPA